MVSRPRFRVLFSRDDIKIVIPQIINNQGLRPIKAIAGTNEVMAGDAQCARPLNHARHPLDRESFGPLNVHLQEVNLGDALVCTQFIQ